MPRPNPGQSPFEPSGAWPQGKEASSGAIDYGKLQDFPDMRPLYPADADRRPEIFLKLADRLFAIPLGQLLE
jgi:hypothetical protein